MKKIIAFSALMTVVACKIVPASDSISVDEKPSHARQGHFYYKFENTDGTAAEVEGDVSQIHGSYKYLTPDGTPFELTYTADKHGYQPHGAHLPIAREVPAEIARLVEYLKPFHLEKIKNTKS